MWSSFKKYLQVGQQFFLPSSSIALSVLLWFRSFISVVEVESCCFGSLFSWVTNVTCSVHEEAWGGRLRYRCLCCVEQNRGNIWWCSTTIFFIYPCAAAWIISCAAAFCWNHLFMSVGRNGRDVCIHLITERLHWHGLCWVFSPRQLDATQFWAHWSPLQIFQLPFFLQFTFDQFSFKISVLAPTQRHIVSSSQEFTFLGSHRSCFVKTSDFWKLCMIQDVHHGSADW